jgi:hypothetical protein
MQFSLFFSSHIRSLFIVILNCHLNRVSYDDNLYSLFITFFFACLFLILKGPIVVEQWLPNKPAPKRITYHHVNRDEYVQNEFKRQRNRFIEYTKPRTTVELEIIRLPIITLRPDDYHRQSVELTKLDKVRSITQDPNTLQWRI